jgi:type I restriction enzyme S subunit
MMSEWKEVRLRDICLKIGSGATPTGGSNSYLLQGPYALIRSQNVLNFTFSYNGLVFINDKQANKLNNVEIQEDDILINITGDSVARVCMVPKDILPARVNQHVAILRVDKTKAISQFLKYCLLNNRIKEELLNISASGGTRKALTKSMLESFVLNIPSLQIQKKIAKILSDIDEKIELNRQQNQTLEEIAQTLFREMCLPKGDELPKGWNFSEIGQLSKVQNGYAFKSKDFIENGYSGIIKIKNINGNIVDIKNVQYVTQSVIDNIDANKFKLKTGDLLIAMTGAEVGKLGLIQNTDKELWLNQRVGCFKEKVSGANYFLYLLLTSIEYQRILQNNAMGSAQPNISATAIESIKAIIPPISLIEKFGNIVKPIFNKILSNLSEISVLEEIRNSLLPKLMAGEIEV